MQDLRNAAAGVSPRRLFVYNGGLLRGRVRRILDLAGWRPRLGLAGADDLIGIWGAAGTAWRGRAVAARRGAGLVHIEDAFLRSLLPGRARGPLARRGSRTSTHKAVRLTHRLTDSPACLASDEADLGGQMRRMMQAVGQKLPESTPYFELNPDHPLIAQTRAAAAAVGAPVPHVHAAPYGSDLRLYNRIGGIPTLHYGPGHIRWAHAVGERVPIAQTIEVARALAVLTGARLGWN